MADKVEYGSEAAANHPTDFLYFEVFPEACIRLAALRYEWRPPENMGGWASGDPCICGHGWFLAKLTKVYLAGGRRRAEGGRMPA